MREARIKLTDAELEKLGFRGLISHVRDVGFLEIQMLDDEGYTCVPQINVQKQLDEALLEDFDCVEDWEFVAERDDSYIYLLHLTATGLSEDFVEVYNDLLGDCDPTLTTDGLELSFVGAQESIRQVLCHYNEAGASPNLHKLAEYEGGTETMDSLTERQLEVVQTALELGFYDVPRKATTDEIASALGLNAATVSEHLQRAERNLLTKQLKV